MARDEESQGVSEEEPERVEGEPLPEPEGMPTARPFAHELPEPIDLPPGPPEE